jgi:hypothetical protein
MQDIQKKSNSHDVIKIVLDKNQSLVLKTFFENFDRVKKNILKQTQFTEITIDNCRISSVKVNNFLIKEHSLELSMKFIDGYNGSDFVLHGDRSLSQFLDKALSFFLEHEISQSYIDNVSLEIFQNKFNQIVKSLKSDRFDDILISVQNKIAELPASLKFPIGRCHGDLTLENIIYNSYDGFMLIDFIDTFLETPLQDVAKINQDLIFGWSARNSPESFQTKSTLFAIASYPAYAKYLCLIYPEQIKLLTLFSLIRILPYLKDIYSEKWLCNKLQIFLESYDNHINDFINMKDV